jgi:hypothetical protein
MPSKQSSKSETVMTPHSREIVQHTYLPHKLIMITDPAPCLPFAYIHYDSQHGRYIYIYFRASMSNQAEQDPIRGSLGSQSTDNAESHASTHESSESNIGDSLSSVATVAAAEDSKERVREVNLPQGNLRSKVRKRLQQAWHWKPKPARYDVDNPPDFSVSLNVLFAVVSRLIRS